MHRSCALTNVKTNTFTELICTSKQRTVPLRPGPYSVEFVWAQPKPLIMLIDEVHFPDSNLLQIPLPFQPYISHSANSSSL